MSTGTLDRDGALREILSTEASRRGRAARLLARWADADVVRALAAALADVDLDVCDAAASSLLMIGGVDTVGFLLPLIRSDHPPALDAEVTEVSVVARGKRDGAGPSAWGHPPSSVSDRRVAR